jgi:hypothetical protein
MSGCQLESSSFGTKKAVREFAEGKYIFFSGKEEIEFSNLGIKRKLDKSHSILPNELNVEKDERISMVFFADFENDIILIFDKSSDESGNILVCRINLMKSLIKWKLELPSMNPSYGVIENHFLYQAGVGLLAKINLISGKVEWRNNKLGKMKSGGFVKTDIFVQKNQLKVVLVSDEENESNIYKKIIYLNKENGEINNIFDISR